MHHNEVLPSFTNGINAHVGVHGLTISFLFAFLLLNIPLDMKEFFGGNCSDVITACSIIHSPVSPLHGLTGERNIAFFVSKKRLGFPAMRRIIAALDEGRPVSRQVFREGQECDAK